MDEKLTDEQVENWRRVLIGMVGPYALIMTREQIQAYRDKVQAQANTLSSIPDAANANRPGLWTDSAS